MKTLSTVLLTSMIVGFAKSVPVTEDLGRTWNILSLDGGGIRGLITAKVVDYMEREAYDYAEKQYCIPKRDNKRVSMAEIFDLVAGTSTGSLLATALVIPHDDPNSTQTNKFFAQKAIEVYTEMAPIVFTKFKMTLKSRMIGTACFLAFGLLVGFLIGVKMYHNTGFEENIKVLKMMVKTRKRSIKGKEEKNMSQMLAQSFEKKVLDGDSELLKNQIQEGTLSVVQNAEDKIFNEELKYMEKKGRKWIVMLIGGIIMAFLGWVLMPKFFSLTKSSYDRRGIESICNEMFGNIRIQDALTKEVNIVAYEYNSHQPRVFSKFSSHALPQNYSVGISNASEASSAAPIYFDPKVIGEQVLIDGGVIANNPAFYAYLHSKYANKQEKIRVISIGTGEQAGKNLDPKSVDKLDWAMQIGTLITVVEATTHDYLMKQLPEDYYRFQKIMTESLALDSYADKDIEKLLKYGDDLVKERKQDIKKSIRQVVDQVFGEEKGYKCQ
eukprot:403361733